MVTLATGFPSIVRMSCSDVNLSLLPVTAEIYGSTFCLWVWPWNLFSVESSIHTPTQTWNVFVPGVALASVQFSSVAQLCPTLFDPKNCSTPGLPVHHQLLESTQNHVHRVSDAIQPSHPLSSPSPPALNLSQHQSLFKWVSSSHQVAKVLEFQLQHQSFQWTPRTDLL